MKDTSDLIYHAFARATGRSKAQLKKYYYFTLGMESGCENTLQLARCSSMVALPPEIGLLQRLVELKLTCCNALESLPPEIGQLKQLRSLLVYRCTLLAELPEEMCQLTNLTTLQIILCSSLVRLPIGIEKLNRLEMLVLSGCERLVEVPPGVGMRVPGILANLTSVDLSRSTLVELPSTMGLLSSLKKLFLSECKKLIRIAREVLALPRLIYLDLEGSFELMTTPKDIFRASYSLRQVWVPSPQLQAEMDCYCRMNKAGRYLLRRHDAPTALWSHVLSRPRSDENWMYWLLTNKPDILCRA